jgi:hypothetical protein
MASRPKTVGQISKKPNDDVDGWDSVHVEASSDELMRECVTRELLAPPPSLPSPKVSVGILFIAETSKK